MGSAALGIHWRAIEGEARQHKVAGDPRQTGRVDYFILTLERPSAVRAISFSVL